MDRANKILHPNGSGFIIYWADSPRLSALFFAPWAKRHLYQLDSSATHTLVALKKMCMKIGRKRDPLRSYEYPIPRESTKMAGQCSIGCIKAKIDEVISIANHGESRYDLAID